MIDEVLSKLIEFLQEASPLVWQTLIKQVYVEAVADLIWAIGLIVACMVLFKAACYAKKISEEDVYSMWEPFMYIFYAGSFGAGCFSFGQIVSALMRFANPEFYAIKFIIQTVSGI